MRIKAAILVGLVSVMLPVYGDDRLPTLKVGDTTYTNVLVLRVTATDIYFSSDNGISNAKLTSLDPAVQSQFAADAAKAAEIEKKQTASTTQYEQALALQDAARPAPATPATSQTVDTNSSATNLLAKSFLNETGPPLEAETWISGSPNMAGKFVLIDFWAPSSEPCRKLIPILNGFQTNFGDRLSIIGISDEPEDAVRTIVDPNIEYSSAVDTQKRMETAAEVKQLPYALLMDTNWIVRWEGNPVNRTNALTEAIISELLDKYGGAQ
jgi:thiol-disulfide isomerase/thioredoxin